MLSEASARIEESLARLASGTRLSSPSEKLPDAISGRFEAQIKRIEAARNDVSNAISFTQAQEGFLGKISVALGRMRELSALASDSSKSAAEKALYQSEFAELQARVSDIGSKDFNGVSLFSSASAHHAVTIDSKGTTFDLAKVDFANRAENTVFGKVLSTSLRLDTGSSTQAPEHVSEAAKQVSKDQHTLGANLQRLQYAVEQMAAQKENLTASDSRLRDVDMANEATESARYSILVQSNTAMLSQANTAPQNVLDLLR